MYLNLSSLSLSSHTTYEIGKVKIHVLHLGVESTMKQETDMIKVLKNTNKIQRLQLETKYTFTQSSCQLIITYIVIQCT